MRFQEFETRWREFLDLHGDWFHGRSAEMPVVYALPTRMLDHRLTSLFGISEESSGAEQGYSKLCSSFCAVTVVDSQPIPYRWLEPVVECLADPWFHEMKKLGWEQAHVKKAKPLIVKANGVAERLTGSIGRLVCSPKFCSRRDELKSVWESLPTECKPQLPLRRSAKITCFAEIPNTTPESSGRTSFTRAFDEFCDEWRVAGMATWDLPDIDGPKWPDLQVGAEACLAGRAIYDTPWHFSLQADDGLGDLPRGEHKQLARQKQVDDPQKWQTYAHLFQIDFWERVLRSRYAKRGRPHGCMTGIVTFIADILQLDDERVQKLRKFRSALQGGKISSLAGRR